MPTSLEVCHGEARFVLNGDGSLYLPDQHSLLLADLHWGKATHFRKAGIPTPQGIVTSNEQRLRAALERHPNSRVFFLGDLFHSTQNSENYRLRSLLEDYPEHRCTLVLGNHDRDLPPWDCLAFCEQVQLDERIELRHEPPGCDFDRQVPFAEPNGEDGGNETARGTRVIAGHLHPAVLLRGAGKGRARIPAFFFNHWLTVLPPFGTFTGHHVLKEPGSYYGLVDGQVFALNDGM